LNLYKILRSPLGKAILDKLTPPVLRWPVFYAAMRGKKVTPWGGFEFFPQAKCHPQTVDAQGHNEGQN